MDNEALGKSISNLTVEERLDLLKKLDNIMIYSSQDEIPETLPPELQDRFFASFHLSFFDYIVSFFRQIFLGEQLKNYICKKAIEKEIKYLSHLNPPILDKDGHLVLPSFVYFLYQAGKISYHLQNFFVFWKKTLSSKDDSVFFALYYFDTNLKGDDKANFNIFHENYLVEQINEDIDFQKSINEKLQHIKKIIHGNIEFFSKIIDKMYDLTTFFTYDFSTLFKMIYPLRFISFEVDFNESSFPPVSLDRYSSVIRTLSKLFMIFPYLDEFNDSYLSPFIDYYNEINNENPISKQYTVNLIKEFSELVGYYAAKDILNRLFKVISKNPFAYIPFYSLSCNISGYLEPKIVSTLEELIKKASLKVEEKVIINFVEYLEDESASHYKLVDANESLVPIIQSYDLRSLTNIKTFSLFYSFYKGVWIEKLNHKLNHLIEFKYYLFPQSILKELKSLIESMNNFGFEFESIDRSANNIKLELMKHDKKSISTDNLAKINLLIASFDDKCKQILLSGSQTLGKIDELLNFNHNDDELSSIKKSINKCLGFIKKIVPYAK